MTAHVVLPEKIMITLRQPIEHAGLRYETLTLRKPIRAALVITTHPLMTKDLSRAEETELTIRMIALFASIPITAAEQLADDDALYVTKRTGEFYGPREDSEECA